MFLTYQPVTSFGTVKSVGLTLPGIFSTSSPITSAGNLSATFVAQPSGTVFAPDLSTSIPTFRSLSASDIPLLSTSILNAGILPLLRGGTGSSNSLGARIAIGAAAVGPNYDITNLYSVATIASPTALEISAGNNIILHSNLVFSPDSTYTIGLSGASRPTVIYTNQLNVAAAIQGTGTIASTFVGTGAPETRIASNVLRGDYSWGKVPNLHQGTIPTITNGAASGTSPTITFTGTFSDNSGIISIVPGTTPLASGILVTIIFAVTWDNRPAIALTPNNPATATFSNNIWVDATPYFFSINVTGAALVTGTTYRWYWIARDK